MRKDVKECSVCAKLRADPFCKHQHLCKEKEQVGQVYGVCHHIVPNMLLHGQRGSAGPAEPQGAPGTRWVLGPAPNAVVN